MARLLAARWNIVGAETSVEPVQVDGSPALIMRRGGELDSIVAMRVEDGLVSGLYFVRDPEKLSHIERETALTR